MATLDINNYIDFLNGFNFNTFFNNNNEFLAKKKRSYNDKIKNIVEYNNVYFELLNIYLNTFKWIIKENKYNISTEIIDYGFLMANGVCLFMDNYTLRILPARPFNSFNIYNQPIEVEVFGFNYNKTIKVIYDDNIKELKNGYGVYVFEYKTQYPVINQIFTYAKKISDKQRALDILTQKLKNPFTVTADKKEVATIEKYMDKIEENASLIIATDKLNNDNTVDIINHNIDTKIINSMKESILFDYNRILQILGVNVDPNPDKKERKLVDEINVNNQLIDILLNQRLQQRQKLCKFIKNIMNINIRIEKNFNVMEEVKNDNTRVDKK